MKVFKLVTSERPFFTEQEKILDRLGVESTIVKVPNNYPRSINDYISFYPKVIMKSLDDYDLVHANYGLTVPFALAQPTRPLVLTLWGSDLKMFLNNKKWNWLCKNLIKLENFNEIMVRSEEMRRNLKKEFGLDAHIVPSGVDLRKFQPMEKEEAKKNVGWELDVKHILFPYPPSRDVKNYPLAKEIFDEVVMNVDFDVKLQVVSGVPHDDIPIYMNAADVMLLTSTSEGSPNVVKEALSCNVPVVSTNVGDVELLLDGVKFSKCCNDRDELVEGVLNAINRDDSSNGRERIENLGLNLEEMGKNILKVYEQALKD